MAGGACATKTLCTNYDLYVPETTTMEEDYVTAVKLKADQLLSMSKCLCGELDKLVFLFFFLHILQPLTWNQGKASNFTHKAIRNICLSFYYNNTLKSLCKFPGFQDCIPYNTLLLIIAFVSHSP